VQRSRKSWRGPASLMASLPSMPTRARFTKVEESAASRAASPPADGPGSKFGGAAHWSELL